MHETESTLAAPSRLYYLDWLRILLVGLVFFTHSLMPFNSASAWAVMNDHTAFLPAAVAGYFYQWVMQLFFVVSGASAAIALGRRDAPRFVERRVRRLAVPYLFGVLALSPVHDYFSARNHGEFEGGFVTFLREFYAGVHWDWSLSFGLPDNHLWFLHHLFWFSMAGLPLLLWFRGERGQWLAGRIAVLAAGPQLILVLALPIAIVQACLRPGFHEHTGLSDTALWFVFFVGGYLMIREPAIPQAIARYWPLGALIGAACMACTGYLYTRGFVERWELNPAYTPGAMAYEMLRGLNTCAWVVFYLGASMRWLNRGSTMLNRANEAVLPFYMLHQPAIVVAGFYLLPWPPPLVPAWITLFALALLATLGVYVVGVYPFKPIRRLFGLNPR